MTQVREGVGRCDELYYKRRHCGNKKAMEKPLSNLTLVLHNIRSIYNVGSIFRTAEAFGVGKIILSGYTPMPLDRFGRARKDFKKSALGAEEHILWESSPQVETTIHKLATNNIRIIALEQSKSAEDIRYTDARTFLESPAALVVGNEVEGVSAEFLSAAEAVVEIPQFGEKESLNVSVALGITLYHFVLSHSADTH